jgi:hypothetical protein
VSASKSPSGPVALGRPFTYTVSVKNTGNGPFDSRTGHYLDNMIVWAQQGK